MLGALFFVIVWLGLVLVLVVSTPYWSVRLWKRRDELETWKKVVLGAAACSAALACIGTVVGLIAGLVKALGVVGRESVDPSENARFLAEGIAEAMNTSGLGLLVGLPCQLTLMFALRRTNDTEGPKD